MKCHEADQSRGRQAPFESLMKTPAIASSVEDSTRLYGMRRAACSDCFQLGAFSEQLTIHCVPNLSTNAPK